MMIRYAVRYSGVALDQFHQLLGVLCTFVLIIDVTRELKGRTVDV